MSTGGIAIAAPGNVSFAQSLTDDPVPFLSMGCYAPILVGAVVLAVATQLVTGLRSIAHDPATTVAAP